MQRRAFARRPQQRNGALQLSALDLVRRSPELPRWYVYADRLTPTSPPFYMAVGLSGDRYKYSERPDYWHKYVKHHKPVDGVRTALEATRMTRRQAYRTLAAMVKRRKPELNYR